MNRPIDISKHIPPVVRETVEFKEIAKVENPELTLLWQSTEHVLNEWYLDTMTEYGISRTEKMLGIKPYDTDTLEDRRFRLKARYNHETPYTYRSLENMISNLCNGDFKMVLDKLNLEVRIGLGVKKQFTEVQKLLERVVPANIVIIVDLLYNTHKILHNYTHAQLAAYTHEHIRTEVISSESYKEKWLAKV